MAESFDTAKKMLEKAIKDSRNKIGQQIKIQFELIQKSMSPEILQTISAEMKKAEIKNKISETLYSSMNLAEIIVDIENRFPMFKVAVRFETSDGIPEFSLCPNPRWKETMNKKIDDAMKEEATKAKAEALEFQRNNQEIVNLIPRQVSKFRDELERDIASKSLASGASYEKVYSRDDMNKVVGLQFFRNENRDKNLLKAQALKETSRQIMTKKFKQSLKAQETAAKLLDNGIAKRIKSFMKVFEEEGNSYPAVGTDYLKDIYLSSLPDFIPDYIGVTPFTEHPNKKAVDEFFTKIEEDYKKQRRKLRECYNKLEKERYGCKSVEIKFFVSGHSKENEKDISGLTSFLGPDSSKKAYKKALYSIMGGVMTGELKGVVESKQELNEYGVMETVESLKQFEFIDEELWGMASSIITEFGKPLTIAAANYMAKKAYREKESKEYLSAHFKYGNKSKLVSYYNDPKTRDAARSNLEVFDLKNSKGNPDVRNMGADPLFELYINKGHSLDESVELVKKSITYNLNEWQTQTKGKVVDTLKEELHTIATAVQKRMKQAERSLKIKNGLTISDNFSLMFDESKIINKLSKSMVNYDKKLAALKNMTTPKYNYNTKTQSAKGLNQIKGENLFLNERVTVKEVSWTNKYTGKVFYDNEVIVNFPMVYRKSPLKRIRIPASIITSYEDRIQFGCTNAALFFYLLVSNTPMDEDYEYTYRKTYLTHGRTKYTEKISADEQLSLFRNSEFEGSVKTKNGIVERKFSFKSDTGVKELTIARDYQDIMREKKANAQLVTKEYTTMHKADESFVRYDWEFMYKGFKFTPTVVEAELRGSFGEDVFTDKKINLKVVDAIANYFYRVTKDRDNTNEKFTYTNTNPRWELLEYGGYENDSVKISSGPKYKHGVRDNFVYQAPKGFLRLIEAQWNMLIESGAIYNGVNSILSNPTMDVSAFRDGAFQDVMDMIRRQIPSAGTVKYDYENFIMTDE